MDTITHGIAGALIGKAFFDGLQGLKPTVTAVANVAAEAASHKADAEWRGKPAVTIATRVAVWAATLGAVFPDSDSVLDFLDPTGMSVITEHRGLTHSLVLLPMWALVLGAATWWLLKRRGGDSPPRFSRLALAYAAGIGSHIFLDLINSWGTMIWMPLDRRRVAWDLAFVIDLTLTAVVLAPQMAGWAYARREGSFTRRLAGFVLFSLGAVGAEWVARNAGFPFSPWIVVALGALFAALFFLPARGGWGFGVSRAAWCRAGMAALAAYIGLCAAGHAAAMRRVEQFVAARNISGEPGAIPLPPSPLNWSGLVRTEDGVYVSRIRLLNGDESPQFTLVANAPPLSWVQAAQELPMVQSYLWFARFPVTSYTQRGDTHIVQFEDLRFFSRGRTPRNPFTFRVTFDGEGRVLEQGWVEDED
jgi:membrane-bound metal-dependent hydrolase YbcI (DUF457 family)